jgi:hypothetical protein
MGETQVEGTQLYTGNALSIKRTMRRAGKLVKTQIQLLLLWEHEPGNVANA